MKNTKELRSRQGGVVNEGNNLCPAAVDDKTLAGMTFKVIPTVYNNVNFRSRLEARWAVFLTALNVKWEYEHEGFDLNGTWYLPDFYLPYWNGGTFIEVKPKDFTETEKEKCRSLCALLGHPVFLAVGSPDLIFYELLMPVWYQHFKEIELYYSNFSLHWKADNECRFWFEPGQFEYELTPVDFPELNEAVRMAKSYRF